MSVLMFDENNHPVLFEEWKFPGGEIGVKLPKLTSKFYTIEVKGTFNSDNFFVLCNLLDALFREGIHKSKIVVVMKYFPYARQDRKCHPGESFALEVFVSLLSRMQYAFANLEIHDPHSDVTEELFLKYFYADFNLAVIEQAALTKNLPKFDVIVAPDAGAARKAHGTQCDVLHVFLDKVRMQGKVLYSDYEYDTLAGEVCVVDDICDGGATFISVGEMLRRTQPRITKLCLYVTHGIFSKGTSALKQVYDKIYISNPLTVSALDVEQI